MTTKFIFKFILVSFVICCVNSKTSRRPNIIVIVADDLGWNDVGFHGSNQIPTPNIDALAYSGIILNNYYVNPICTPSRSALMTGLHPIHTGMQSYVIREGEPHGVPLKFKFMPQLLADNLGYKAHAVGKWHLGHHRKVYLPTKRGFLSHFGYWSGMEDYYDHTVMSNKDGWGYDLRRNLSVAWDDYGRYATDLFTDEAVSIINDHGEHHSNSETSPLFLYLAHLAVHSANFYAPLQAPKDAIDRFNNIEDDNRRKFAGMLYKLDESVGRVTKALQENDMLKNSIIVFTTDNGGPAAGFDRNHASNWPLKGTKNTLWEGGVRGAGFVWSPLLKSAPRVANQMMNIQDWLPTLYVAAGGKERDFNSLPYSIDGMSIWKELSKNKDSPRNLMLHNIDDTRYIAALRIGDWKFNKGTTYDGNWDSWFGPSGRNGSYDYNLVRKSLVSGALKSIGMPLHSDKKLEMLRKETEIKCAYNDEDDAEKPCHIKNSVCLFNIMSDPCEQNNLAFKFPSIVHQMEETLRMYKATEIPPGNKPIDPRANPKYYDYTWTNWMDIIDPKSFDEILAEDYILERNSNFSVPKLESEVEIVLT